MNSLTENTIFVVDQKIIPVNLFFESQQYIGKSLHDISPLFNPLETIDSLYFNWSKIPDKPSNYTLEINGYISKKGFIRLKLNTILALAYVTNGKTRYKDIDDVISNILGYGYPIRNKIQNIFAWKGVGYLRNFFEVDQEAIKHNYKPNIFYDYEYSNNKLSLEIILQYKK